MACSSSATSRVAFDIILLHDSSICIDSPPEVESRARNPRDVGSQKRASVIGLDIPDEANNSIDNSNIANMNQGFLKCSYDMVRDSIEKHPYCFVFGSIFSRPKAFQVFQYLVQGPGIAGPCFLFVDEDGLIGSVRFAEV